MRRANIIIVVKRIKTVRIFLFLALAICEHEWTSIEILINNNALLHYTCHATGIELLKRNCTFYNFVNENNNKLEKHLLLTNRDRRLSNIPLETSYSQQSSSCYRYKLI